MVDEILRFTFPDDIGNLVRLESLIIRTHLVDDIPSSIGNLTSLRQFELSHRASSKYPFGMLLDMPSTFDQLTRLEVFILRHLTLSGFASLETLSLPNLIHLTFEDLPLFRFPIATFVKGSPSLQHFHIANNLLTGAIGFLDRFENLKVINITSTNLVGDLGESFWQNHSKLEHLELSQSRFSLTFGSDMSDMPNLKSISATGMIITGTLPSSIGWCLQLEVLNLRQAHLTGSLPSSLGNLFKLRVISISTVGRLSGELPPGLGHLPLETIHLDFNDLSGSIPEKWSRLTLKSLNLNSNRLTGTIPNITFLLDCSVDLSHNTLEGTIPASMADRCTTIDLSHNNLGKLMEPAISHSISADLALDTRAFSTYQLSSPSDGFKLNPTIFANNSRLIELDLSFNNFHSPLPILPLLGANLRTVILSNNYFSGAIPPSYCRLKKLDLSLNDISDGLNDFLLCSGPIANLLGNDFYEYLNLTDSNDMLRELNLAGCNLNVEQWLRYASPSLNASA